MAALKASRFVWLAISLMVWTISWTSCDDFWICPIASRVPVAEALRYE